MTVHDAPAIDSPNREFIDCWNDILVPKFKRFRSVLVHGFRGHSDTALAAGGPVAGQRVLDVGCGFGETSIELAGRVGPAGSVLGIDCCEGFTEVGASDAAKAGVTNVRFEVSDAQTRLFEGEFDFCFARFGTMFFQSPKAAMRNLRSALRPQGRLLMIVWRSLEDNEWVRVPTKVAAAHLPPPPETGRTCGPGPFSMADRESVTDILTGAGFVDVVFTRVDVPVTVGATVDEALDLALQIGPAGELMREAGDIGIARRPVIEAELRRMLAGYQTDHGIVMPSSSWAITARAT